ncbi:general substrate transporter [Hyaloscypha variabilis]
MLKHDDSQEDVEKNARGLAEHLELSSSSVPFHSTNELSYGESGLKGLLRSPYVFGAAFLASLGGFSFGYDQGVISLILVMPQFHKQFPETTPVAPGYGFHVGFMTGMLELGAFVGCLFFPKLADRISRKWGLSAAVGIFCVGAVIQTAAQNYGTIVAGRFIGGIGVGTLAMGAPLYISEIAPPDLRGSLLTLEQLSIRVGFPPTFVLQMVSALGMGIFIHFFPYSPRWLALRGRDDDCLRSLMRLRGLPSTDIRVQREWKGILTEIKFQNEIQARDHPDSNGFMLEIHGWMDLFRRKCIKRTIVAIGVPFIQQFSGINAFVYYAPTFFAALGQDYEMSLILTGMVNICQLVAVLPVLIYLDKIGRRTLALWGGIAMGIPHVIMAGIVGKFSTSWSSHTSLGWFGVALVYIYILTYGASYGPLAWVMPAEVFPNSLRAKGVGAATATIWLSNFVIGVSVPPMMVSIGYGTFIFFACFCLLGAVFSFFFVPETSGKTLEEMDQVFKGNLGEEEIMVMQRITHET